MNAAFNSFEVALFHSDIDLPGNIFDRRSARGHETFLSPFSKRQTSVSDIFSVIAMSLFFIMGLVYVI
uniref:Uncharacterized protein n=1 Tax=uncultured marine virus TaxID=186617 RepID=A0A0F7L643_9VIRU|nr:hypothetical protein [uncultured marine virus]